VPVPHQEKLGPLTPTGTYHLVSFTYEVAVECQLKCFTKVSVSFLVVVVTNEEACWALQFF
jgi:hypothetical protein